jgi:dienelactone hydrolase
MRGRDSVFTYGKIDNMSDVLYNTGMIPKILLTLLLTAGIAHAQTVIILPGSKGPDNRTVDMAQLLEQNGIHAIIANSEQEGKSQTTDTRIGIMGFSQGGREAVLSKGYKAYVGFYPQCNRISVQPNTLIIYGTEDQYGEAQSCPRLNAVQIAYPGAHHSFDRKKEARDYRDLGRLIHAEYNEQAMQDSYKQTIKWFKERL